MNKLIPIPFWNFTEGTKGFTYYVDIHSPWGVTVKVLSPEPLEEMEIDYAPGWGLGPHICRSVEIFVITGMSQ